MQHEQSGPRSRYDEGEVRAILARAIELDTRSMTHMSLAEVQRAAAEIGLAPELVEQAVAEFEQRRRGEGSVPQGPLQLAARHAVWGVSLGVVATVILPHFASNQPLDWILPGTMLTLVISGLLASGRSGQGAGRAFLAFEMKNAGLWVGFTGSSFLLAWALLPPEFQHLVRLFTLTPALALWGISSSVGGAVAAWRSRLGAEESQGGTSSRVKEVKRVVRERLKGWIDHLLARSGLQLRAYARSRSA